MPPNIPNPSKSDPLDSLIRQHLTTDNGFHTEAYEVVRKWYVYLNALSGAVSHQVKAKLGGLGVDAVEEAFETPVAGFQGNTFWQYHGQSILPLIQRDMVSHHLLSRYSSMNKPDLAYSLTVLGSYSFIGLVVSLVQKDGLISWKSFEISFRELMDNAASEHLNHGRTRNN